MPVLTGQPLGAAYPKLLGISFMPYAVKQTYTRAEDWYRPVRVTLRVTAGHVGALVLGLLFWRCCPLPGPATSLRGTPRHLLFNRIPPVCWACSCKACYCHKNYEKSSRCLSPGWSRAGPRAMGTGSADVTPSVTMTPSNAIPFSS